MLIPSTLVAKPGDTTSLSRRVNANSQHGLGVRVVESKLIKKGEC